MQKGLGKRTYQREQFQPAALKIITLKVSGIREEAERIALGSILIGAGVDVIVQTETHLAKRGAGDLAFPNFVVANENSLAPDQARMRGGVAILVKQDAVFEELPVEEYISCEVAPPLYSCSAMLYIQTHPTRVEQRIRRRRTSRLIQRGLSDTFGDVHPDSSNPG